MRAIRKSLVAAAAAAAIALGTIAGGTALADPSSTPPLTALVGVGDNTTAPLFDQLTSDYDGTNLSNPAYSWDAVNPQTGAAGGSIIAKAASSGDTSCQLTRPDGSLAAAEALNDNQVDSTAVNGQSVYCIDFAQSFFPNDVDFSGSYAALAEDAIAWSYPVISGQANPQPASLTKGQLAAIYGCTDTNWDQVGGANAPIVPVLPEVSSGTRSGFLAALGITAGGESCWVNGTSGGSPIENDTGLSAGNTNQFDNAAAVDDIFPYSISDWIAQEAPVTGTGTSGTPGAATVGGHATPIWGHGDLELGETANPLGTVEAPTSTNTFGQPVINPNFNSQFKRIVYERMRNGYDSVTGTEPTSTSDADWPTTPALDATELPALFGPSGWVCTNPTAQSDIVSYGFARLSSGCGALVAGDGGGGIGGSGGVDSGATISGTVENSSGTALSGVSVEVCVSNTTTCYTTTTSASGSYSITGLGAGSYEVDAQDPPLLPGHAGPQSVSSTGTQTMNLVLLTDTPLPSGVNVSGATGNPPLVHWQNATPFSVTGCPNGTASFTIKQNGGVIASGPMTETPPGSGIYTGTIPPFKPNNHGYAQLTVTIACPGGSTETIVFCCYIDPSGIVVNTAGQPIGGATVTLLYAESASGPFEPVPDGSDIMSPANQENPMVTAADGYFGWDTVPGFYEVQATESGCYTPGDPSDTVATTPVLEVPPAATGLVLTLDCSNSPAPAITSAGDATFTAGTGGTFTVTSAGDPTPTLSETGSLPSGVSFTPNSDGTATLTVSPAAAAGETTFTVNAANGVGSGDSQLFTLTVNPAPPAPAITSAPAASFTAGTGGTFTVSTTGTPTPTLSETGSLPSGVTFTPNSDGTATLTVGTSAPAGSTTFTITATNTAGAVTQTFSLEISVPAPTITSPATATFTAGTGGTFTVTTTGTPTPTLSETGSLPSGVTFTPNSDGTATLTVGTDAPAGTTAFTFTATNGVSPAASQSFTLSID
jgi:hypothetical protein